MPTPRNPLLLWPLRLAVVLGLALATAHATEFPRFETTFSSPPHTVGMPPLTQQMTASLDRVTQIVFGRPIVVSSFGPLTDQPLELLGSSSSFAPYSQIEFYVDSNAFIVLDADLCVRSSTQTPKGNLSFDFDAPEDRNVTFLPNGDVTIFVPGISGRVIGHYELDRKTHFRAEVDLVQAIWRLFVNGVLLEKGNYCAHDLQGIRINHTNAELQNSTAGIDNVFITDYGFAPTMIEQPQSQVVHEGDSVTFSALSYGGNLHYQWLFNGNPIPGATGETYTIDHAFGIDAGSYSVSVQNTNGSAVSDAATLGIIYGPALIQNISTRLRVESGDNALIAGFIVQGDKTKKVILRAIGPSLAVNRTPIPGRLLDPVLELYDGAGNSIAQNDNWQDSQKQEIVDSTVPPVDDRESAIVANLSPGNYTAVLRGTNNSTGIAVVELYDLDTRPVSKVVNISTRGRVSTGDNVMIGGFILGGHNPATILVRGIGPSLNVNGVPLSGRLSDPFLELYDVNGGLLGANNNWRDGTREAVQQTGAAPSNDLEAAFVIDLPPGSYTVLLRDAAGGEGIGLFEAYNLSR